MSRDCADVGCFEDRHWRECSAGLEFTSAVAVWGASRLPTAGNHSSRLLEEHALSVSEQSDSMDTFCILSNKVTL